MRPYFLPAIPDMLEPGASSPGLSMCGSVLALPHRGHGLFLFLLFLNYTFHTQRSLWCVYFSISWMVTGGSLVDVGWSLLSLPQGEQLSKISY